MTAPEQTPTPWQTGKRRFGIVEIFHEKSPGLVASARSEEDAAFIVRAVNAHEDLLKACKLALRELIGTNVMGEEANPFEAGILRAAIAKAEGRS